ncbi:MAG: acyl--CoA ligase [Clostridia bacterium]|nr:acyl--CoA ligase [Clostridia bacterium]
MNGIFSPKGYLEKPIDESCYEYLKKCYRKISKDIGEDYTAFVTPVGDTESKTSIKRLFNDVEKISSFLVSKGIKKGDVLTAFLPTCGHAFIAFYAVTRLGAIVNFVHPFTPVAQLKKIMLETGSKGIFLLDLFADSYKDIIREYMAVVCSISDFCDGTALKYAKNNEMQNAKVPEDGNVYLYSDILSLDLPATEGVNNPGKEDAVYLHGGGTTGRSKTIIHSNYSFNFLAYSMYALDPEHSYEDAYSLCVLPCFHAYGLGVSMHYALCNAYRPIMISKFDPVQANELIRKYCVMEIMGVPNMYRKMVEADNFENEGLRNLTVVSVGGDFVETDFVDMFNEKLSAHGSSARLSRGYGLTEMCAVCTSNAGASDYKNSTVGVPVYGTCLEIWDEKGNKLPVGEIGEIAVTGETIMNGYLPDGVMNDSGFYTDKDGIKWIRTGDVGYLDEDGHLVFKSRIKRIIVISGYNVYPATIEEKINELPYIKECCACQGYDEKGKPYVKLVVSLSDRSADEKEIKEKLIDFCKENFERYCCPKKVIIIDELPKTKMEKIDFISLSDNK